MFDWLFGKKDAMAELQKKADESYANSVKQKPSKADEESKALMDKMNADFEAQHQKLLNHREAQSTPPDFSLGSNNAPVNGKVPNGQKPLMQQELTPKQLQDLQDERRRVTQNEQFRVKNAAELAKNTYLRGNEDVSTAFGRDASLTPQQMMQSQNGYQTPALTQRGMEERNNIVNKMIALGMAPESAQAHADMELSRLQQSGEGQKLGFFGVPNTGTPNGWLSNGRLLGGQNV